MIDTPAQRVVVVGSLNMDLVARVNHLPQPGETISAASFETHPGGKGANQAAAAARLGADVALIGRLGTDGFAQPLLESLRQAGVDTAWVTQAAAASTGTALITVEDSGQNSIVVVPGANHLLHPEDIDQAEALFRPGDLLLMQLETPLETVTAAARLGHTRGMQVMLNPAPAQPLPADLLRLIDILIPNEAEAAALLGLAPSAPLDAEQAAQRLQAAGASTVIITLGERGAWLSPTESQAHLVPAFPVRAVDTTAAGDAFCGGLAAALARGLPLSQAARWGCAAGALTVAKAGAQPALPDLAHLLHLLGG